MSDTKTDMAKVTQMLDAGWHVRIYKGGMGSYEVRAHHVKQSHMRSVKQRLIKAMASNEEFLATFSMTAAEMVEEMDFHDGWLMTDDSTPGQALTRMAYKVLGEVI